MPELRELPLKGAYEIVPTRHGDDRGFFSETYNAAFLSQHGIDIAFVQDNHSFSSAKGVLRGLHFQAPPFAQDKLVRVSRGRVWDVLVDVRKGSPTYGQSCGVEVSADKWNQVLVPKGFLHGFLTLEENTEFLYKVSAPYSKEHDSAVRYDDPDLHIEWPAEKLKLQLSDKDRNAPTLAEIETGFVYGEI